MIHTGRSDPCLLFPEQARVTRRGFSVEELLTEREVASAFKRYPRKYPCPYEIPYYPFVYHNSYTRSKWPYQVSFNLGYNPFKIN